jgi:hypothetical protein
MGILCTQHWDHGKGHEQNIRQSAERRSDWMTLCNRLWSAPLRKHPFGATSDFFGTEDSCVQIK